MEHGKFEGYTGWIEEPSGLTKIKSATLLAGGSLLNMEFLADDSDYSVSLKRTSSGNRYEGIFLRKKGGEGKCSCALFQDGSEVILFGRWKEEGDIYTWWAELQLLD